MLKTYGNKENIRALGSNTPKRRAFFANTYAEFCDLMCKSIHTVPIHAMQDSVNCRLPNRASSIFKFNPKHVMPQTSFALYHTSLQSSDSSVSSHSHSFVASLKACAKLRDYGGGTQIHAEVARMGLVEEDLFVGSALINLYAKCGLFVKAQEVFDRLTIRNVVSWNAMISSYADHGYGEESLKYVEKMTLEGIAPNSITFLCGLKSCSIIGDIGSGHIIHASIEKTGLMPSMDKDSYGKGLQWHHIICANAEQKCLFDIDQSSLGNGLKVARNQPSQGNGRKGLTLDNMDQALGNSLVDMYAKCGSLISAQNVFDKLPTRDVVTWNALISAYVEHGYVEKALSQFDEMQLHDVSPDSITFSYIVKACSEVRDVHRGNKIYAEAKKRDFFAKESNSIGKALIDMYVKHGFFARAEEVFDEIFERDLVIWNALLVGYAEHGYDEEVLRCFEQMKLEGISPDYITYLSTLKAYGNIRMVEAISRIHIDIEKMGFLSNNPFLASTLVDMYAKCGCMVTAQQVFDRLQVRNVVSWTALITGNARYGYTHKALECFQQMQLEGISPNELTFVAVLKACSNDRTMCKGQEVHVKIDQMGLLASNTILGSTLVNMYAKHRFLDKAQETFDKLANRDVIVWTSLISGYSENGHCEEALKHLEQMKLNGISPDVVSFVCGLKACGTSRAKSKGLEIHSEITIKGLAETDVITKSLVDMYARCGLLGDAQLLFNEIKLRDVVSWNSLINGYAQLKESENVFYFFKKMLREGMKPDAITFVIVLSVCSRVYMIEKSQTYFEAMSEEYGIRPMLEHYSCMTDVLIHVGRIDEAIAMVTNIQQPHFVDWHKILRACKHLGNSELGRLAFQHAVL